MSAINQTTPKPLYPIESVVHKSINVLPQVWRRLRLNAELSDTSLRTYLTHLALNSEPCDPGDERLRKQLDQIDERYRRARRDRCTIPEAVNTI